MQSLARRYLDSFETPAERLGAHYVDGQGVYVRLWAPYADHVDIIWNEEKAEPLARTEKGYFSAHFKNRTAGDLYMFRLNGDSAIPDPASRYQPRGPFGPSEVIDAHFDWSDQHWRGVPFDDLVIYEIHTGSFSNDHDFNGVIHGLERLKNLGITMIEIMPVSQFSGTRNWGYDGVFPHSVQNSYGGPPGLKRLVNEAHKRGIGVILDVVYNHIGPEGNILFQCGPYTHDKYHTPWGDALNFDGAGSDEVRRYFLQTVWQCLVEYRLDGLRLDAVQAIFDTSPVPFLEDISRLKNEIAKQEDRDIFLIAETDMNDPRLLKSADQNGMGMDVQWADDLHHALHASLTGERDGYYRDYGGLGQIANIYNNGVAYGGEYSPFRQRRHGRSYQGIDKKRLIVQSQNHDQIGNRLAGERLITLAGADKAKLAAAAVLLSPFTPLLFMGEEYGAENPFLYFISHEGDGLVKAVREGRKKEWKDFGWKSELPDPAAKETFEKCVLDAQKLYSNPDMQDLYRVLIEWSKKLRKMPPPMATVDEKKQLLVLHYESGKETFLVLLSFEAKAEDFSLPFAGQWECLINTKNDRDAEIFTHDKKISMAPFSAVLLKGIRS